MNSKMNKLLAFAAVALMVATVAVAFVGDGESAVATKVASVKANANDNILIDDDGVSGAGILPEGLTYDGDTHTLTLTNADLEFNVNSTNQYGISMLFNTYTGDVNIVIKGSNSISVNADGHESITTYGICTNRTTYISGESMDKSSLTITSHSASSTQTTVITTGIGVMVGFNHRLNVSDCNVNLIVGSETGDDKSTGRNYKAIMADGITGNNVKINMGMDENTEKNYTTHGLLLGDLTTTFEKSIINYHVTSGLVGADSNFMRIMGNTTFTECNLDVTVPGGHMVEYGNKYVPLTFDGFRTMSIFTKIGGEPEINTDGTFVVPAEAYTNSRWTVEEITVDSGLLDKASDGVNTAVILSIALGLVIGMSAFIMIIIAAKP